MTTNKPMNANTAPKDQVAETRRVLKELNDKAERAIDEHVVRFRRKSDMA